MAQLDNDAINTDPGAPGNHYSHPHFPQLQNKHKKCPIETDLKAYGQTIVPFFISPNSNLSPQLSEHFTDMLIAEEQIPLEILSKYQTQGKGARSLPLLVVKPCPPGHVVLPEFRLNSQKSQKNIFQTPSDRKERDPRTKTELCLSRPKTC